MHSRNVSLLLILIALVLSGFFFDLATAQPRPRFSEAQNLLIKEIDQGEKDSVILGHLLELSKAQITAHDYEFVLSTYEVLIKNRSAAALLNRNQVSSEWADYIQLVAAAGFARGQFSRAEQVVNQALSSSQSPPSAIKAKLTAFLGELYLSKVSIERAFSLFRESVAIDGQAVGVEKALYWLALKDYHDGATSTAKDILDQLAQRKLDPELLSKVNVLKTLLTGTKDNAVPSPSEGISQAAVLDVWRDLDLIGRERKGK